MEIAAHAALSVELSTPVSQRLGLPIVSTEATAILHLAV
jgi:hypothetical protein